MQPSTIRALKILVVVMGVAIIAGTATLGVLIVKRLRGAEAGATATPAPLLVPGSPLLRQLDEPGGTVIAAIALSPDRLAVQLRGGGPDRVVLIDARTGATIARITLAQ